MYGADGSSCKGIIAVHEVFRHFVDGAACRFGHIARCVQPEWAARVRFDLLELEGHVVFVAVGNNMLSEVFRPENAEYRGAFIHISTMSELLLVGILELPLAYFWEGKANYRNAATGILDLLIAESVFSCQEAHWWLQSHDDECE